MTAWARRFAPLPSLHVIESIGMKMRIVYLDQNKWIELAHAAKFPTKHPEIHALVQEIADAVADSRVILPLAATNIYETHKINDRQRRSELASFQALFSRGIVFRGRYKRLEVEISMLLRRIYNLTGMPEEPNWFLSTVFFEAFLESNDERFIAPVSDTLLNLLRVRPDFCLYDYLVECPEDVRLSAVKRFSAGSEKLRQRVENRRAQHSNESVSMRRKLYSALLMLDEIELILAIARRAGVAWSSTADMEASTARRIITDVPAYHIEREIALRLESQDRPIHENDFRDMQSFCAVLPYADQVIGENQFVNLAQQAGVNRKYRAELATNILAIRKYL